MSSHKSRDDEIYERGVHDGQRADAADRFAHSLAKNYTLNPRENEIYNKGYDYGVAHPHPATKPPSPPSSERGDYKIQRYESPSSSHASPAPTGCLGCGGAFLALTVFGCLAGIAMFFVDGMRDLDRLLIPSSVLVLFAMIVGFVVDVGRREELNLGFLIGGCVVGFALGVLVWWSAAALRVIPESGGPNIYFFLALPVWTLIGGWVGMARRVKK